MSLRPLSSSENKISRLKAMIQSKASEAGATYLAMHTDDLLTLISVIEKQRAALDTYESMNGPNGTAGKCNRETDKILESL